MITGFHLIDSNMDGIPELWASISPGMGMGPWHLVLSWDFSQADIEGLAAHHNADTHHNAEKER